MDLKRIGPTTDEMVVAFIFAFVLCLVLSALVLAPCLAINGCKW